MRAFARFRNEIWCMDLSYVDKLAKENNNGVKYLLVRQDLFDRTVNAKGMKTKESQGTVKSLFIHDYKKESTEKDLGCRVNRTCWSVQKVLYCWGDTSLLYKDWD